jgi:hypothetical protein
MGLFLAGGHWPKILPQRGQVNVCTVYVFVYGVIFSPPVAEIFARLAGNFCH